VFGIVNISGLIFSIIFGKMMIFWGRKRILKLGIVLICLSTVLIGILEYISESINNNNNNNNNKIKIMINIRKYVYNSFSDW
jgi:MFS family permease